LEVGGGRGGSRSADQSATGQLQNKLIPNNLKEKKSSEIRRNDEKRNKEEEDRKNQINWSKIREKERKRKKWRNGLSLFQPADFAEILNQHTLPVGQKYKPASPHAFPECEHIRSALRGHVGKTSFDSSWILSHGRV
jgi:hypothetical protein